MLKKGVDDVVAKYVENNPHQWDCRCSSADGQAVTMAPSCVICFLKGSGALDMGKTDAERRHTILELVKIANPLYSTEDQNEVVDFMARLTVDGSHGGRRRTVRRKVKRSKRTQHRKKRKHPKKKHSTVRRRRSSGRSKRGNKTRRYRR